MIKSFKNVLKNVFVLFVWLYNDSIICLCVEFYSKDIRLMRCKCVEIMHLIRVKCIESLCFMCLKSSEPCILCPLNPPNPASYVL